MLPSDHLRRKRWKTFKYWTKQYEEYDPTEISDLPDHYSSNEPTPSATLSRGDVGERSGEGDYADNGDHERYRVTEFDMAYPSSFSGHALPSDLPDHAMDGINICHHLWQDMIMCQLFRRYDKHCQREMLDFLKCRHRRDKAVALRSLQFETWKVAHEADEGRRLQEINERQRETEEQLAKAYRDGNITEQRRCENDLAFLDQRMLWIEKTYRRRDGYDNDNGNGGISSHEELSSKE